MNLSGIQTRLLVSFGVISLLPILILLFLIYTQLSSIIKTNSGETFQELAQQAADKIQTIIYLEKDKLKTLNLFQEWQNTLRSYAELKNQEKSLEDPTKALKNPLSHFFAQNKVYYQSLSLYDKEGTLITTVPKPEARPSYSDTEVKKILSSGKDNFHLVPKKEDSPLSPNIILHMLLPIIDKNNSQTIGALSATLNFHIILDFLKQLQLGKGGRTFFVSDKGHILFSSLFPFSRVDEPYFVPPIQPTGKNSWTLFHAKNGKTYLRGYAQVFFPKNAEYYVLMEQPLQEVFSPIYRLMATTASLSFIIITVSFLIGMKATGGILHSLRRLKKSAKSVGLGMLDEEINIDRLDEIGELTESFNQMIRNLKKAREESSAKSQELARINEELKKQNELKGHFLSTVSHELRTPLTTLAGYIKFLKDEKAGPLSHEQYEGLKLADKQISHLSYLIDQLLDHIKIISGRAERNASPVFMQGVFHDCLASLKERAQAKEIQMNNKVDENLPLVYGDRNQLVQIATNLLENALKYTPKKGKIKVDSREQEKFIEFSVRDTGKGIPEEYQEKIFEKYFRVEEEEIGLEHGFGLGLSIVKDLVVLNEGRIWCQSKPGEGTHFFFLLPKYRA